MEKVSINQPTEKDIHLKDNIDRIKNKIVVFSGKGGVGKSTVAVNLAYGLALNGKKVGIMDVDMHGPSIAKMLGIEGKKLGGPKSDDRPTPIKVHENLWALSIATFLPDVDEPVIWRGPLKNGAIKQFMQDIEWPELDYMIIDCPPGTGDEILSVAQILKNVNGSVIVSTPQDISFLDARKTIKFSKKMNIPILGIVENMAYLICPKCGEKIEIFAGNGAKKASKDFDVDILGSIPIDPNIVKTGDTGRPYIYDYNKLPAAKEMNVVVEKIINKMEK